MSRTEIRQATLEDVIALAFRLRKEDFEEAVLLGGPDVLASLTLSLKASAECYAGLVDGQVVALWGVSFENHEGFPWLMASDGVEEFPILLTKVGRTITSRWLKRCSILHNWSSINNVVHHNWLKLLGFTLGDVVENFGVAKAPFLHFYRRNNVS